VDIASREERGVLGIKDKEDLAFLGETGLSVETGVRLYGAACMANALRRKKAFVEEYYCAFCEGVGISHMHPLL
jgi:hypothetical protein